MANFNQIRMGSNQNIVSEDQMRSDKNAKVFELDEDSEYSFPDAQVLMNSVIEIMTYATKPELKQLRNTDKNQYFIEMEKKFPDFSMRYYGLFMKVINGEDITPLLDMMIQIDKINKGKISIKKAEENVGMGLYNKFVKK